MMLHCYSVLFYHQQGEKTNLRSPQTVWRTIYRRIVNTVIVEGVGYSKKKKYCDKVINLCHKESWCVGLRAVNKKEEEVIRRVFCVFLLLWVFESVYACSFITTEIQIISYYQILLSCFIGVILLKDSRTHISYLLDTVAALSLVPFESVLPPSGPNLSNINGKTISSWKFVAKHLTFGKRTYVHNFLQSSVPQPIQY